MDPLRKKDISQDYFVKAEKTPTKSKKSLPRPEGADPAAHSKNFSTKKKNIVSRAFTGISNFITGGARGDIAASIDAIPVKPKTNAKTTQQLFHRLASKQFTEQPGTAVSNLTNYKQSFDLDPHSAMYANADKEIGAEIDTSYNGSSVLQMTLIRYNDLPNLRGELNMNVLRQLDAGEIPANLFDCPSDAPKEVKEKIISLLETDKSANVQVFLREGSLDELKDKWGIP